MTSRKGEFDVGDIVYQSYSPAKCGVVIEVKWPDEQPVFCLHYEPIDEELGIGAALRAHRCAKLKGHDGDHESRPFPNNITGALTAHVWPNISHDLPEMYQPDPTYVVKRVTGGVFESRSLSYYSSLIDDHQRKLDRHRQKYEALMLALAKWRIKEKV